ncbi:right-handed parallel beta-helix repeat-containing protein [Streptomyces sp. TRM66268-LWL]|uniref:Right-handed parallel beta-helix repeat-containing protein n=1 Tax=Streptomyces polyasparticus TaxID=2767826 RepID=A0ABR7SXC2_9ACTN|nr:carbohydrate binding domain-containing protein [Streptomyces polyasparticus]MBC9719439.1 right-handed parallel beta-helix repeat-containing protein [Streptomyces polyasparticus]
MLRTTVGSTARKAPPRTAAAFIRGVLRAATAAALTAGALVATAGAAQAANTAYYVDCSAATDGSGTQASPWNTLATVNARTFGPGDQILFKRGATCTGQLYPKGSGAAGSPIIVDAYGTGAQPKISGNGVPDAVYLYNQEYWELRNLDVSNTASTTAVRTGVRIVLNDFGTGDYYRIKNLNVHDVSGDLTKASVGISLDVYGTTTQTKFHDAILDGNTVRHVDRTGISNSTTWNCNPGWTGVCSGAGTANAFVPWTGIVFRNNTISDTGGDGLIMRNLDRGLAEHNTVYDAAQRSMENNAGLWTVAGDGDVIQNNEVYRVKRQPGTDDGMAFDADIAADSSVFQYNYSHDNEGGFMLFCGQCANATGGGSVVRYNLSQNDKSRFLYAVGQTSSQVYNNTVYLPAGSTTKIIEDGAGKTTKVALDSNIFYNLGTGGYSYENAAKAANYDWSNNTFYGHHPANEPTDPGKSTADPLFTNPGGGPGGYGLQASSPARGSGLVITNNGGKDYNGNPVPAVCRPDRGAFQSSSFTDSSCSPLLANGTFDSGASAPWTLSPNAAVTTAASHNGGRSLKLGAAPSTGEQTIAVLPNTTYIFTGWMKTGAATDTVELGVKNHGGSQLVAPTTSTTWVQKGLSFTTGPSTTTATVFCYHNIGGGSAYCDDLQVVRK